MHRRTLVVRFWRTGSRPSHRRGETDLLTAEKENIHFLITTLSRNESFEDLNTRTRGVKKPKYSEGLTTPKEGSNSLLTGSTVYY